MVSVVARSTTLVAAYAAISWVAICAAAGGAVAFGSGNPTVGVVLLGVVLLVVAVAAAAYLVVPVGRGLRSARVELTPEWLASPTRRSGWPGWAKSPTAPQGVLAIPVDELPVPPEVLARVVALRADDPALRAQLGTPASADWSSWLPGPAQPRP